MWCISVWISFAMLSLAFPFLLSFQDSDDTNAKSFVSVAEVPRELIYFSLSPLCCSDWVIFIVPSVSSLIVFLYPFHSAIKLIHWVLILVIVFFSSEIFISFFHISCISFLRFCVFFSFVLSIFIIVHWSNNSNYCWYLLFFFNWVWDLYGSLYDEWFPVEIWTLKHHFMQLNLI